MRTLKYWLLGLLLASPAAFPLSGNVVATDNVKAHLVSEVSSIAPGESFWVALEFNIRDGWHTYWRNPGDSGQATSLKWQLPPGFTAGPGRGPGTAAVFRRRPGGPARPRPDQQRHPVGDQRLSAVLGRALRLRRAPG